MNQLSKEHDQSFYDLADQFIHVANAESSNWPRMRVSEAFLYAASRFNAFNWLTRTTEPDQTPEEAIQEHLSRYEAMLRENLELMAPQYPRRQK